MTAETLLAEAARRGIELDADDQIIRYRGPKTALVDLKPTLAAHKGELLSLLRIEEDRTEALALLNRLKTFTLTAGRIPAAREIAQRCADRLVVSESEEPAEEASDPASILAALRAVEDDLVALGGLPDPRLTQAIALVVTAFPDARLIELGELK